MRVVRGTTLLHLPRSYTFQNQTVLKSDVGLKHYGSNIKYLSLETKSKVTENAYTMN